jgi:hypothetical protein
MACQPSRRRSAARVGHRHQLTGTEHLRRRDGSRHRDAEPPIGDVLGQRLAGRHPQLAVLVEQHHADVDRIERAPDHLVGGVQHVADRPGFQQRDAGVEQELAAVVRAAELTGQILGRRTPGLRVPARDPQLETVRAGRGEVVQQLEVVGRPLARAMVDRAQRPEHIAVPVDQRHPGVADHAQVTDRGVVADPLVVARVDDDQRLGRGHLPAEGVAQRRLARVGPRRAQPGRTGKELPVRVDQRNQGDGYAQSNAHHVGEAVEHRIGHRTEACLGERPQTLRTAEGDRVPRITQ